MSDRRHPVRFTNRDGLTLVGIVHEPSPERRTDVAVVLLSPGVKNRIAPHRLYNKMAARFVAQGFWVLRFDFYGLGDSDGLIGERLLADFYGSVALGRYIGDTHDAMDWMRRTYPVTRFVLGGLCGGAITGLLAARTRPDAAGILGLGLPVMVEGSQVDKVANMTAGQLSSVRTKYLRKLLDPRSWLRLLTFQSDWRLLTRALRGRKPAAPAPQDAAASTPAAPSADNTNPNFTPAFLELLRRGCPSLLLFSEMDRLWWEFDEKFLASHRETLARYGSLAEIGVIAGANHIFTLDEWQADMLARCSAWLDQRFGSPAGLAASTPAAESGGRP
jgi:pimeloyl-ACP methyl ester carboxylesterase